MSTFSADKATKARSIVMEQMEDLLCNWLEDANQRNVPISLQEAKFKAKSLFEMLKKKQPQPMTEKQAKEEFQASNGWWHRFCERKKMGSVKLHGEIASADNEGAETYLDKLKEIIEQGGYSEDQIFNVDESGLFWKMPPTRTIMSKTKGQAPGMKLQKARCSILFGGNASGDLKLKPLLIHQFENPRYEF